MLVFFLPARAQPTRLPPVWLNATARLVNPVVQASSTCDSTSCTLVLDSAAGILVGDTVSGSYIPAGGDAAHAVAIPDGTTVSPLSSGSSIVITVPSGSGETFDAGNVTSTQMLFKNVNELACIYDQSAQTLCPRSGQTLGDAVGHISVIEVNDDDLRDSMALDAAFPGGYLNGMAGFQGLLGWMYNTTNKQRIDLAITVGDPTLYIPNGASNPATCESNVQLKSSGAIGDGALLDNIQETVGDLAMAFSQLGLGGHAYTIRLDLDEPLNHAYYSFVGTTGEPGSGVQGTACPVQTLASLAASILDHYQHEWNKRQTANLPTLTFVMGGEEAPAKVYNSPTFNSNSRDLATFIDDFHTAAMNQPLVPLVGNQLYYNFLLLDIGPTENDWKIASEALFNQVNTLSAACTMTGEKCPAFGEIFALAYSGPLAACPQNRAYYQDNSFCAADAAAVAGAQLKIQDFLNEAATHPLLKPQIIRISSYNHPSPSHLLPNTDPTSLTSIIDWLYSGFANPGGTPAITPNTIFKLSQVRSGNTVHVYVSDLATAETMIAAGWTAEYPIGEAYQQAAINPSRTLQQLFAYTCNRNTMYESNYFMLGTVGVLPHGCESGSAVSLGFAAGPTDECTLIASDGSANNYPNDCPNVADIPVFGYETTSTTEPVQYYYTVSQNDIVIFNNPAWAPIGTGAPQFYVQSNLPRYQDYEPIAFQAGLRTASGNAANASPLLQFFSSDSADASIFGFQTMKNMTGYFLGVTGLGGTPFQPLICNGTPPNNDCGDGATPMPCAITNPPVSSVSCASAANMDIEESPYGDPVNPGKLPACCSASLDNPQVGLEAVTNFLTASPYLRVYSNDNNYVAGLQQ